MAWGRGWLPRSDNDRDGIPMSMTSVEHPENKNGIEDEDGCPEGSNNDRDGDGIPQRRQVLMSEDFDGFRTPRLPDPAKRSGRHPDVDDLTQRSGGQGRLENEDAAPIPTTTRTHPDKDDRCEQAETYSGFQDKRQLSGSWTSSSPTLDRDPRRDLLQYDKAIIRSRSYPILDAVAATCRAAQAPADRDPGAHRRARRRQLQPRPLRPSLEVRAAVHDR